MQSLRPNPLATYRSVPEALYKMIRNEGIFRPIKGVSAVITGAGPAHALYFSCYEKMKRLLSGTETGAHHPLAQGLTHFR
jgi:solute carrier family 25 iron transporter 28/37